MRIKLLFTVTVSCSLLLACSQENIPVKDLNGKVHKIKYEEEYTLREQRLDVATFKYQYKENNYRKYEGTILSDSIENVCYFQFDTVRIYVWPDGKKYRSIFQNGLVTPQMIYCEISPDCIPPQNFISTKYKGNANDRENLYGWYGPSIRVEHVEELVELKTPATKRRFKFWVYPYKTRWNGINNIFYLELTNENATSETSLEDFIKSAKVSFLLNARAII